MSIIGILLIIIVVGVLLWLVNTYIPMDATIKRILNVVAIVLLVLWLLSLFFDLGSLGTIHSHRWN
jgi:hypothetical protein